ncbi:MAG: DUF3536 domain-containing protein [Chloroflexi bacterium]|nr:DUF3536 domain-containing protein [Chloroflexota bacterium]
MRRGRLVVHGHFYQPERRDPFSGLIPVDPAAAPYPDWTSRIADECYGPNAERGNFSRISWNIGPALASWLRTERPRTHELIRKQASADTGIATAFHHTILPLASPRDRRTEIRWGLRDFELRFGRRPVGLWLPETAVDRLTLRICAEEGVRYTILAPWQAAVENLDPRRPYEVDLGEGHRIVVMFYHRGLSTAVSFDPSATTDADRFVRDHVRPTLDPRFADRVLPTALVATDGELYGHHQQFRDLFLARLTSARYGGVERAALPALLERDASPGALRTGRAPEIQVRDATSWSCLHGIARWSAECPDTRDGRWKQPLRAALDRLAAGIDAVAEREARQLGVDLWAARDGWVQVASGYAAPSTAVHEVLASATQGAPARAAAAARDPATAACLETLLTAQASRLSMYASDAWFWEDPSRPETAQAMRFAGHAARLVDGVAGTALERSLVADLEPLTSPLTGADGAALYRKALALVDQPAPRA